MKLRHILIFAGIEYLTINLKFRLFKLKFEHKKNLIILFQFIFLLLLCLLINLFQDKIIVVQK